MIKQLLEHLGIKVIRQEAAELVCQCPWCESDHLSVNTKTGAWQCFRGCGEGHPYQLARKLTSLDAKGIFELLERFGLGTDSPNAARTQTEPPKPKKPAIKPEDIVPLTDEDVQLFCSAKNIDREALLSIRPMKHRTRPWVLLPACDPTDMNSPCGWIRCGIDGKPVEIRYREKPGGEIKTKFEKYPVVAGSVPGLLGLHSIATKNPDTIILAEGWKDALAAIQAGYAATCNSQGAKTWRDNWKSAFKDKTVYIVYDRDDAGVKGADKAARSLWETAKEVRIITLPYEMGSGGDLHDYICRDKNTNDNLLLLLKTAPAYKPGPEDNTSAEHGVDGVVVLPDDHPDTIAEAFEAWNIKEGKVSHCYNSIDGWSIYHNNKYQKVEDEKEIEVYLRRFLQLCKFKTKTKNADGGFDVYNAKPDKKHKSPTYINSILKWLRDIDGVHLRPSQKAPCSLDGSLNPANIIATKSCLLEIETGKTHPLTKQYYTFNYLPYNYEPDTISDKWGSFLVDITDGDADIMILLQQWCGYLLMPTNKFQRFLLCVGDGANGKGVFFDTITAALGRNNVSNANLASFIEPYKVFATFGKMANMSNENAKNLESNAESVIKEYTSGDKMLWEQKYKDAFSAYPTAKLMFATNILPIIRDTTDGIWRRMLYVPFDVNFPEDKQNKDLGKELQADKELAGILNWMLEGRKSLIENDGFVSPKRCQERLSQYRNESNSGRLFITEHLEISPDENAYIVKSELYSGYQKWCKDNGYHAKGNSHFGQDINKYFPLSKNSRLHFGDTKKTVYIGIKLQEGVSLEQGNSDNSGYGHSGSLYENSGKYD